MFGNSILIKRTKELEEKLKALSDERHSLKEEVEDLKSKKKIEEEQIKHLVKIKDEKRELEYQRKEMESARKRESEIAEVKDQYRDKMEQFLIEQAKNVRGMHDEILKRLPDVNVRLKGDV